MKSEIRNPKSEGNSKPEYRGCGVNVHESFGIRHSVFGIVSDFGFRISDF
ncbi:MAG TPA: hypothetical protein VN873_01790 [Candidatus Angelobacter sp.]|nr:hypothetical protein [Candidatus Angelobacter sp.]